jgi:hypothetical protein
VPLQLRDSSSTAVLEDDLGEYNKKKWRLFGFSNGRYVEFPNAGADVFTPGQSLFLIVKESNKTIDAGPGQSIRIDREFKVPLKPGHNFVATPFNFGIPKRKLRLWSQEDIELQTYSGQWISADSLLPWEGYHLANSNQRPDTLFINPK